MLLQLKGTGAAGRAAGEPHDRFQMLFLLAAVARARDTLCATEEEALAKMGR
jgi:hypothetical protein